MDIAALRSACKGVVATTEDENSAELLHGNLWNRLIPDRAPRVLVRAADEQDVIAAIRFARANGLKVVVRGGGHNWCQPTLRRGGLLIDISEFTRVISLDVEGRRAVVQPIISNRDVQKVLNAQGLAYPSGHCPQVKLSGYLLGGGMSWNQGVWGAGAESVEAVEIVTPDGELITASKDENVEWFWAARGAGSGFFGVVTRYHLRLHPLPRAIHGSTYWFSLDAAPLVADWLGQIAPTLDPSVELSLFLLEAPPELREAAAAHGGKVCMVTATAFANTGDEAMANLQPLEDAPARPLQRIFATPLSFEQLFDGSGALWPEGLRNRVEATFSNASPLELVRAVAPHIETSPSPLTLALFVFFTGPHAPVRLEGMAYSMSARIYGGPWTMWREADEDAANAEWHAECVRRMQPFLCGAYIGESDTAGTPADAVRAFSPASWQRLADLRAKLDPDGLFFDYFEGFHDAQN
jgi:FAD/FMN-containing dehydrogenase